jgi:hypothetical protein
VTARRHHYVPQFYLRGFTRNGGKNSKLFAVDLLERRYFWTTPANVCAVRDFNRIEAPGLADDALETSLSSFERAVARAFRTIVEDRSTRDSEAWLYVLNLMSVIAVRNPHMRGQIERYKSDLFRMIGQLTVQSRERWDSTVKDMIKDGAIDKPPPVGYEDMKRFIDKGEYTFSYPPGSHVPLEFAGQDAVLRTLVDRKWLLLTIDRAEGEFITTDLPVCLLRTSGDAASLRHPVGHGLLNTTVLFPLTTDLLAMGSFEGRSGTVHADRNHIADVNLALATHCDSSIFARTDRFIVADRSGDGYTTGADVLSRIVASPRTSRGKKTPKS